MGEINTNRILLEFTELDLPTCKVNEFTTTDTLYYGSFFGTQIFKIGDQDFTADLPILGFARELAFIANQLSSAGENAIYVDPELQDKHVIEFSRLGHSVTIKKVRRHDKVVMSSASITVDELLAAAHCYLKHVVEFFTRMVPRLSEPTFQRWFTDFSLSSYQRLP